jgi:SET domain-containing protein
MGYRIIIAGFLLANTSNCIASEMQKESAEKWTEFSSVLKPSSLGGIGVFATHDIKAGVQVLSGKFSKRKAKTKEIPAEFLKYCMFIDDEECWRPERFDKMEIGWFLNHSDHPNIAKGANDLFAVRDIKAGEEILIDYNQFDEPDHLKESYYWPSNSLR